MIADCYWKTAAVAAAVAVWRGTRRFSICWYIWCSVPMTVQQKVLLSESSCIVIVKDAFFRLDYR
jgi:hypothetical protein